MQPTFLATWNNPQEGMVNYNYIIIFWKRKSSKMIILWRSTMWKSLVEVDDGTQFKQNV